MKGTKKKFLKSTGRTHNREIMVTQYNTKPQNYWKGWSGGWGGGMELMSLTQNGKGMRTWSLFILPPETREKKKDPMKGLQM